MTSFLNKLNGALARHRSYRRTIEELRAMPLDVALDLDIDRRDAKRIAYETVYRG